MQFESLNMANIYEIDEYGRAIIDSDGLFELWFKSSSVNLSDVIIKSSDEIIKYNNECDTRGKEDFKLPDENPEPIPHNIRNQEWLIPEKYQNIDVREFCLAKTVEEKERLRIEEEMDLFEERKLIPLLQSLIYMIDCFRDNKILWGVGRGSSVSSYVLYLIGVHRINPITYNLDISEFLR